MAIFMLGALFSLSACGKKEEVDYLKWTAESSSNEALLEKYACVAYLSTFYLEDGEEKVIHVHERVEDCEKYVPDEQLTESVFGGDLRTLTVIADPNTENEKTYTCFCDVCSSNLCSGIRLCNQKEDYLLIYSFVAPVFQK